MLVLCLQTLVSRGRVGGLVVGNGAWWRRGWRQVVASSLRVKVGSGSYCHGVNRTDHVCYRMLLMSTWLLDKVRARGRRGRRRRWGSGGRSLVMNTGVLGGQKMPRRDVVSWHRLLTRRARKCLVWSG